MIHQTKQQNLASASASAHPAPAHAPQARAGEHRTRMQSLLRTAGMLPVLLLLCVGFGFLTDGFLTLQNLSIVTQQASINIVLAAGMTFVILTGGIDLSVGSVLAAAAVAALLASNIPNWGWLGIPAALAVGLGFGVINGGLIALLRLPPFIVTLGGMTIWRGLTLVINDGAPIAGFDQGYRWWGRGELLGISIPIWIFAIVALGGYLALHKTRWGRFVYAIGGNPEAARLAGVNVKRVLVSVYVLIGCLAGLAGFILSARLGSAEAVAGISFELRVIASVVIGGTSLMGGYGRIGGTIIGSIIMGILINGLVLMNVSAYYQQIITGLIIVLAVAFDTYAKSRRGAL
ncbi:ABC transporter permease [Burkholderia sp.]|uniref:ABC transporter permease n=1 Tax=Burkholderia sp. TaxID=36773 RepID=UPI0025BA42AE|nr:ABC transporter permease [Burkholderia sp.]MBS6363077.1 ABC transporter permease [Burkholderia sp.]